MPQKAGPFSPPWIVGNYEKTVGQRWEFFKYHPQTGPCDQTGLRICELFVCQHVMTAILVAQVLSWDGGTGTAATTAVKAAGYQKFQLQGKACTLHRSDGLWRECRSLKPYFLVLKSCWAVDCELYPPFSFSFSFGQAIADMAVASIIWTTRKSSWMQDGR